MMDSLTSQFENLKVSKTTLHDFVEKKCKISVKRACFYAVERNTVEKIQERKKCVQRWQKTDIDFMSNCIFIDESGININIKRSISWSKKGERDIVTAPKRKASNITILDAVASYGVVNKSARRPKRAEPSKKGKVAGASLPLLFKVVERVALLQVITSTLWLRFWMYLITMSNSNKIILVWITPLFILILILRNTLSKRVMAIYIFLRILRRLALLNSFCQYVRVN